MFTVIYKPTTLCNLACKYCYVGLRHLDNSSIDTSKALTVFKAIIESLVRRNPHNNCIIMHGGEPLLMGKSFYGECDDIINFYKKKNDLSVDMCIQTNLTLLDDSYIELLKKYGYQIGTSLDGTEEAHDFYRKDAQGQATFKKIVSKIEMASRHHIKVRAICCVSQLNLREPQKIYQFFNSLGVSCKFNYIDSETGLLPEGSAITQEEYSNFLITLARIWLNDPESKIDVLQISDMISAIINKRSEQCIHAPNCSKYFIGVDPDGDIYPCGKFIGIGYFKLGNVCDLDNAITNTKYLRSDLYTMPDDCKQCEFGALCNGLCPFERYIDHHSFDKTTRWCKAYKVLWPALRTMIEEYHINEAVTL